MPGSSADGKAAVTAEHARNGGVILPGALAGTGRACRMHADMIISLMQD